MYRNRTETDDVTAHLCCTKATSHRLLEGFSFPNLPKILGDKFSISTSTPGRLISESKKFGESSPSSQNMHTPVPIQSKAAARRYHFLRLNLRWNCHDWHEWFTLLIQLQSVSDREVSASFLGECNFKSLTLTNIISSTFSPEHYSWLSNEKSHTLCDQMLMICCRPYKIYKTLFWLIAL